MTVGPDVVLPPRLVGPSLTAAGLASWMFTHAGREREAAECVELQDLIDAALRQGAGQEVRAPQPAVSRAAELWEDASGLADSWAASTEGEDSSEWGRHAERLRVRAQSLRRVLETAGP